MAKKYQPDFEDLEAELEKLLKRFYPKSSDDDCCECAQDAALTIVGVLGPLRDGLTK